jgi:putative FmdB family regulatory protein
MPTYEYKCDACGHGFEKFQSMSAEPIRKCPQCGKLRVKRMIGTGAGLIFKGSGFYITDYRDQSYKDKAKADSSAPAETKSETPAAASGADVDKPAAGDAKTPGDGKPGAPAEPAKSASKSAAKHSGKQKHK